MSTNHYSGQALIDWLTEGGKHPLPDTSACTCELICIDDEDCPMHGVGVTR